MLAGTGEVGSITKRPECLLSRSPAIGFGSNAVGDLISLDAKLIPLPVRALCPEQKRRKVGNSLTKLRRHRSILGESPAERMQKERSMSEAQLLKNIQTSKDTKNRHGSNLCRHAGRSGSWLCTRAFGICFRDGRHVIL